MYLTLKLVHVGCAAASFMLFFLRGLWVLGDSPRMQARWVRVVPHVIDATLLASALGLTVVVAQYPFVNGWLTVKVLLLVVYIALGMVAMRFGRTRTVRMTAWLGAILVLAYIVLVAVSKQPFPFAGTLS